MKKEDRQRIFDKYGGHCAYCGCELTKGWHVDHLEPLHRITETIGGDIVTKDTGLQPTDMDFEAGNWMQTERKTVTRRCLNPGNERFENYMPSCQSCNLYKHSADLETFRMMLERLTAGLQRDETRYRFAKKFGLIQETGIKVKFYFETYKELFK